MARIFVISGPSGSGKSTLCNRLLSEMDNICFSVSATTRSPRAGEKNGVNYYFLTKEEFDEKLSQDAFYEYADVFGNKYGTLKEYTDEITNRGCDVILDIDVQGAMQVREKSDSAVLIFIMPPSLEELKARLTNRATESEEQLNCRIGKAAEEISKKDMYDYVIINDDVESAYQNLKAILEHYRQNG